MWPPWWSSASNRAGRKEWWTASPRPANRFPGFAIEGNGDIATIAAASRQAKDYVHWASEKQREEAAISELWVSVKCGESDTTSGLASNPTVGNVIDKLEALGATTCFGETSELTGAEKVCATGPPHRRPPPNS